MSDDAERPRGDDQVEPDGAGAAEEERPADPDEDADATAERRIDDPEELVRRVAAADEELAAEVEALAERAAEADRLAERVETLRAEVDELERERDDLESRLKRTRADFQNYKKRREQQEEDIRERATEDLVERLLDVRDNLARALEDDSGDVEAMREGVKMTLDSFDRVLDAENVSEIDPEPGAEVDPTRHEVMMRVESDRPEGTVADVYRSGYEMGDRVLRAAQVTVSEGPGDDEDEAPADDEAGDDQG